MISERHPNITILGSYEHCNKPVQCYCNKHNYYFETTPRNLNRIKENGGCPICIKERGDSTIRLTQEEFVKRVKKKIPSIQIIGKYYNNSTKIECYCEKHDYTWMADPKVLLDGSGCKKCGIEKAALSRTCTQDEFKNKLKSVSSNIEVVGEYINALTNIRCRCTVHNYYWEPTPASLLWGEGCPKCGNELIAEKNKYTQEEYENYVYNINPWLKVVSTYKDLFSTIQCKCTECNSNLNYYARTIMYPTDCPICNYRKTATGINDLATTHPYIIEYLKDKNDAYHYRYNSSQKISFKCPICGDEKMLQINKTLKSGYHCTFCDEGISTPNRIIRNLLRNLNATNRHFEYSPDWAGRYRYDAYFEYNDSSYVVEMDGGFHFRSAKGLGITEQSVKETKKRDNIKDKLAKEHNITMVRIKCIPETLENIIAQLKNSILADMFDLENVDWNGLLYYKESLLTEICDCYNNSRQQSAAYVSRTMGISSACVRKYLLRGTDLGLCYYNPKNVSRKLINTFPVLTG